MHLKNASELSWVGKQSGMFLGTAAREAAHFAILRLSAQERQVHVVDGAIRFDAFRLSEFARAMEIDVDSILERITIQRTFSPYQVLEAARDVLSAPASRITFFLSPFKQFLDNDVASEEALFLLQKLVKIYRLYQQKSLRAVFVEKGNISRKPHLYQQALHALTQSSHKIYHISRRELWAEQSFPIPGR